MYSPEKKSEPGVSGREKENAGAKKRKLETGGSADGEHSTGNSSRPSGGRLSVERLSSSQPLRCRDLIGHHGDKRAVNAVVFSGDGSLFASGGKDGRVLVWSTSKAIDRKWTPNPTAMETKHDSFILCLVMSPNNERVFSGGLDNKLLIHNIST